MQLCYTPALRYSECGKLTGVWQIRERSATSILTPVSGFLKEAGFTHSLSPARNCTYGCTYCYVPTMRIYGGLTRDDWTHWGQFTTLKTNAADLATRALNPTQIVYCSPLVDPYQPAERKRPSMPRILEAVIAKPPKIFVIQTRGPLILRDMDLLRAVANVTRLRISFSITTDRDEVRRRYEPHCEPNQDRLETIQALRETGFEVYATLAPLLPCDPERLAMSALHASHRNLIGDPLHVRATKPRGATTRAAAFEIARKSGEGAWFSEAFQRQMLAIIQRTARDAGFDFASGVRGFSWLAA